jgi:ABC-type cobalamin/Fe3+-siderophores transport system ATPase subunit
MPIVERKALNDMLAPLIGTKSGQYFIIVGPRGCGKSTAVEQACQGKDGVARIRVDKNNVNTYEVVADAFGIKSPHYSYNQHGDLVRLFRLASAKKGDGWVPTIVAEIDRGSEPGTVANVAKALKVFLTIYKRLSHLMQERLGLFSFSAMRMPRLDCHRMSDDKNSFGLMIFPS